MVSHVGIESALSSDSVDQVEEDASSAEEEDASSEEEEEDASGKGEVKPIVQQPANQSDQDRGDLIQLHLFIAEALHLPKLHSPQ